MSDKFLDGRQDLTRLVPAIRAKQESSSPDISLIDIFPMIPKETQEAEPSMAE